MDILIERNLSLEFIVRLLLSIIFATISGAILGYEREKAKRPAGLRTIVFVTVGSAVFSFASVELARIYGGDPLRITANIATGIGFLGAGTIVRRGDVVEGLTTASVIWFCGAVGTLVGTGYFIASVLISLGGLVFLKGLEFIEKMFIKSKCAVGGLSMRFSVEDEDKVYDFVNGIQSRCGTPHKLIIRKDDNIISIEGEYCKTHTHIPNFKVGR